MSHRQRALAASHAKLPSHCASSVGEHAAAFASSPLPAVPTMALVGSAPLLPGCCGCGCCGCTGFGSIGFGLPGSAPLPVPAPLPPPPVPAATQSAMSMLPSAALQRQSGTWPAPQRDRKIASHCVSTSPWHGTELSGGATPPPLPPPPFGGGSIGFPVEPPPPFGGRGSMLPPPPVPPVPALPELPMPEFRVQVFSEIAVPHLTHVVEPSTSILLVCAISQSRRLDAASTAHHWNRPHLYWQPLWHGNEQPFCASGEIFSCRPEEIFSFAFSFLFFSFFFSKIRQHATHRALAWQRICLWRAVFMVKNE